jgi:zinc protease
MLMVPHGAAADPADQPGLAAITADMLGEGSGGRSALEVHEALARIGGQADIDVGSDAVVLTLGTLARFADRGLVLLADMVTRPTLAEADFSRVRDLRLHRFAQLRDLPAAVAERAFVKLLYGDHPYGHTSIGNAQSVARLSVDDVRACYARQFRPSGAVLVAVGDCDHSAICRLAGECFVDWNGEVCPTAEDRLALPAPLRLNIVSRPGAPQSELRIGCVAASRDTPDYYALVALNMVIGGQFVSRVNVNLRGDKGLTYGANTSFDFRRMRGPFVLRASVQTAATARAIEESLGEFGAIRGARPVTDAELSLGVAGLTRGYARGFETAQQIARAVTEIALFDLPDDYFARFVPQVERVTTQQVTLAAGRFLDPAAMTTLVVGDVAAIRTDLAGLGMGEPGVPSLDLF